jgi:hypothetical protein
VRPAGLRHDIAPLTASAVTNPSEAMIDDMAKLAGAVAVFGDPILFVAAPERDCHQPAPAARTAFRRLGFAGAGGG